jgi:predicted AAA+ superfamily ATPase
MKDRNSDELFTNDSIQETMSLAARFGLTITFQKPGKDLFLEIVESLAKEQDLSLQGDELIKQAEAFALRNNGRSPRTAKQFVELEKIKETVE